MPIWTGMFYLAVKCRFSDNLARGKFHKCSSKDEEIDIKDINKIEIGRNASKDICSCGREDASAGTTGYLDLYEGETYICRIK